MDVIPTQSKLVMLQQIETLIKILQLYRGHDHAICADKLLMMIRSYRPISGLPELRNVIHEARQRGHLIGSCQEGYFWPVDLREAMQYIDQQFRVPARDELRTARLQRRRALELFGRQPRMM